MFRKILALIALTLGVLAMAPTVASASTGYQLDNVSDGNVTPGQQITVNFNGFAPGTPATITFESVPVEIGVVTVNAQGVIRESVTIPADAALGNHEIVATGVDRDGQAKVSRLAIVVSATGADTGTPTGGLPATGTDIALTLAISGAAIAIGWGLLGATRRRNAAA
jgi:LPXTG-motif cell wall-anchored protein